MAQNRAQAALFSAVDRREAWLWILAMFVASCVALQAPDNTMAGLLRAFGEHNLVYWLCYAVIAQCISSSASEPLDGLSLAALVGGAAALGGISLLSMPVLDGLIATGLGLLLYRAYGNDPRLRGAAIVFIALAVNIFWAKAVFAIFKEPIVVLDTRFTEVMLRLSGYEVERTVNTLTAGNGFYITIIGACSAFNNLSLAVLATIAALIGVRGHLQRRDLGGIALVCLVLMIFNSLRLSVFASSRGAYEYWHEGAGIPILAVMQTAVTLAAVAFVVFRSRPKLA